ncbi:hypothetical protein [Tenacibaculum finnmarkense]|nr:hypothetical protein [Tenacibaculum finnmarkense]MCG8776353.1 hypothetical protein [Tenacibaculum finnmarkense]
MKRLRNIGIYYAVFGILLMISFIFTNLWRISIIGIILLLVYFFLKIVCKKKKIVTKLTKQQLQLWDFILVILPFVYVLLASWYVWRPYKQTIILPKNYEGVVAIQYDRPNGQKEKWTGGFLGIGTSRVIEVDNTGIAKTQFKFHNNAIPFLGAKQNYQNKGGLKIYYENDLNNEIIKDADGKYATYESNKGICVFFSESRHQYDPIIIFTVANKKHYNYFFMNKKEKDIWMYKKQKKSNFYIEEPTHVFNEKFNYYNNL